MNRTHVAIGILFLASALLVLPIFVNGIPVGPDLPHHYRFAIAFQEGFQDGAAYPAWNAPANHGFGDVGVRFYPPLAYYVLNAFRGLTKDWFYASAITFQFLFFVGGLGAYLWSREWFDETAAIAGGILYILMPYHANQLFNAFLFAEFAAAAILPFCFLFATKLCREYSFGRLLLLGLSYAALLLTHLPTAVIGSAGLAVYSLFLLWRTPERKHFSLAFAGSVATGLALSSFYWIKLVTESSFVKHTASEFVTQDYDFRRNFLLSYFYVSGDEYASRSLWFGDAMLFATLLATVPAIAYFVGHRPRVDRPEIYGVLALLMIAIFFSTPLSLPVWEHAPLLAKIQFPFRWMSLASLAAAVLVAAAIRPVLEMISGERRQLALLAGGCLLIAVAFTMFQVIRPARFEDRAAFEASIGRIARSESCECWWPIWASKAAFATREPISAAGRNTEILVSKTTEREIMVEEGTASTARLALFYYPNWKATVNGAAVEPRPSDDGSMLIDLPAEMSRLKLEFVHSQAEMIAYFVSLIAFGLIISFFGFAGGRAILESRRYHPQS